jgi:hypothetical protein
MDEAELERVRRAFTEYGELLRGTVTPEVERVVAQIQQVVDALRSAYRTAGAIYGDTDDGMLRWLNELGEVARCKARIEELRQHQEPPATLRRHRAWPPELN